MSGTAADRGVSPQQRVRDGFALTASELSALQVFAAPPARARVAITPRMQEACEREGVEPHELRTRPMTAFQAGPTVRERHLIARREHAEQRRLEKLRAVMATREHLIRQGWSPLPDATDTSWTSEVVPPVRRLQRAQSAPSKSAKMIAEREAAALRRRHPAMARPAAAAWRPRGGGRAAATRKPPRSG